MENPEYIPRRYTYMRSRALKQLCDQRNICAKNSAECVKLLAEYDLGHDLASFSCIYVIAYHPVCAKKYMSAISIPTWRLMRSPVRWLYECVNMIYDESDMSIMIMRDNILRTEIYTTCPNYEAIGDLIGERAGTVITIYPK